MVHEKYKHVFVYLLVDQQNDTHIYIAQEVWIKKEQNRMLQYIT